MVNLNPPTKTIEGLGKYHRCLKCNTYLSDNSTNAKLCFWCTQIDKD